MEIRKMNFSKEFESLLKQYGYTQSAFAQKVGTTQATVNRWIRGVNQPDYETLFLICEILDTTPNEILGWDD